jgi:hypothetical protein
MGKVSGRDSCGAASQLVRNTMPKTKASLAGELQKWAYLFEHKASEEAEACREFVDLLAKLKKAERGSDRYFALTAELSTVASVLQAKAQSLQEIDDELTDLPDDD